MIRVRVVVVRPTCILEVVQSQSSLPRVHRQGPRSQMDAPLGCMKASLSHVRSQHTVSHSHNVRVTISLAYILCDLCKHTYIHTEFAFDLYTVLVQMVFSLEVGGYGEGLKAFVHIIHSSLISRTLKTS